MQVMHIIRFNKFFILWISFHLIDLHDNKVNMIFSNEIFFKEQKNMTGDWD